LRSANRLLLCAALACWAQAALAIGEDSYFVLAQLKYEGSWDVRGDPGRRLAWEVVKRTSVEAQFRTQVVDLRSPDLFRYPMLYMCGDSAFEPFTAAERKRLRQYLDFGGLLVADDCVGQDGSGFDESFRREMALVYPKHKLTKLAVDHSVPVVLSHSPGLRPARGEALPGGDHPRRPHAGALLAERLGRGLGVRPLRQLGI